MSKVPHPKSRRTKPAILAFSRVTKAEQIAAGSKLDRVAALFRAEFARQVREGVIRIENSPPANDNGGSRTQVA